MECILTKKKRIGLIIFDIIQYQYQFYYLQNTAE
jgi:hypothetical protein